MSGEGIPKDPGGTESAHFLTLGTEWLRDAEAASVVTERMAVKAGAASLVRIGTALGSRRARDNIVIIEVPLDQLKEGSGRCRVDNCDLAGWSSEKVAVEQQER